MMLAGNGGETKSVDLYDRRSLPQSSFMFDSDLFEVRLTADIIILYSKHNYQETEALRFP